MTYNAGAVTSTLTADSKGFIQAYDQARAAMLRSKQAFDEFRGSMLGANKAYEAQAEKTKLLGAQIKDAAGHASRMGGAMSALGGAMGESGGQAAKAATAFGGFAQMLGAGGPAGVALATAAVALQLLNSRIEEQKKLEADLDEAWTKGTAGLVERRDAAAAATEAMKAHIAALKLATGFSSFDRTTQMQLEFSAEIKTKLDKQLATTVAIGEAKAKLIGLDGAALQHAQENLEILTNQRSTLKDEVRSLEERRDMVPALVKGEDDAAKLAAKRAKSEADALAALREQADLLRSIRAAREVAGMLPFGGRLQSATGGEGMAPAFEQLQLGGGAKGPHFDFDVDGGHASAFDRIDKSMLAASDAANAMALNLPQSTKTVQQAQADLADIIYHTGDRIRELGSAIATGHGAAAAGTMLGGTVGAAVATGLAGPEASGVGGAIGELLGGLLGDALDKLIDALGVLTPLFDAVGDVIVALTPILDALKTAFYGVRIIIDIGLARPIEALAEPLGALVLVVANLIVALAPWLGTILELVVDFFTMTPVLDLLTTGLQTFAAELEALAGVSVNLYNRFVDVQNAVIDFVRSFPGEGNYGHHQDHIKLSDMTTSDNTDAVNENTTQLRKLNDSSENLPSIYKVAGRLTEAEPGRQPGGGMRPINVHGDVHIHNVPNKRVADMLSDELNIRSGAQRGGAGGPDDDSN
jgi:hypothetical protein